MIKLQEETSTTEQVSFRLTKGNGDVIVKEIKEDKNHDD